MDVHLPAKFKPLTEPHRYKVLFGGRDAAKSWTIARILLLMGSARTLRILCAREIQKTIADSVHKLLSDQIKELGLGGFYQVKETSIIGQNHTEFMFAGLHQQTADNLKSYEGVDIAWCEEAHKVTKRSWGILIPTIRKDGSEIWVSFNPDMDTDDTYMRFVVATPPNTALIRVTWRDNPWRSKVLDQERETLKRADPQEYEHIYEGRCNVVVLGAIYAKEVTALIEGGRFRPCPWDPRLKVHAIWDMGWNDACTIIMGQRLTSEIRIIDYIEDNQRTVTDYCKQLDKLPYRWGKMWLPHDAGSTSRQTGKTDEKLIKEAGFQTHVGKRTDPNVGIKVARMIFPRVYIDNTEAECETGFRGPKRLLECLKRYKRHVPLTTNEPGDPVHDEYSHGADAFRELALSAEQMDNDDRSSSPNAVPWTQSVPGVM